MARSQKEGLDYFPLDTDIAEDEKILYLEVETGLEGFAIYVKLLSTIYRNSYYMIWTETQLSIYSRRFFVDKNTLSTVVSVCKNIGLFDKNLFEKYQIYCWIKSELFMDLHVTGEKPVEQEIDDYIMFFNEERPAYSLNYLTPKQYREAHVA